MGILETSQRLLASTHRLGSLHSAQETLQFFLFTLLFVRFFISLGQNLM
jgi:hypothetical protein